MVLWYNLSRTLFTYTDWKGAKMANGNRKVKPNGIMLKDSMCYIENCILTCYGGSWDEENRPLCKLHATRWRRTGDPLGLKSTRGRAFGVDRKQDLHRRFIENIEIGGISEDGVTRHLLWSGHTQGVSEDKQYGRIFTGTTGILVHRYAYEYWIGPIEKGMDLDHRQECPKNCVNPAHLTPRSRSGHMEIEAERRGPEGNSKILTKSWITRRAQ